MSTNNFSIRAGTLQDAAMLAELGSKTFRQAFGADNTPENMAAYLEKSFSPQIQAEELARPGSFFLIAEQQGAPAGYARLQAGEAPTCITGSRPIELVRIYLLEEWKGRGMGSRLMEACLDTVRGGGQDVIWLGVWEKNPAAIGFYKKWGFEIVGSHAFWLGNDEQRDWLMQRRLE